MKPKPRPCFSIGYYVIKTPYICVACKTYFKVSHQYPNSQILNAINTPPPLPKERRFAVFQQQLFVDARSFKTPFVSCYKMTGIYFYTNLMSTLCLSVHLSLRNICRSFLSNYFVKVFVNLSRFY